MTTKALSELARLALGATKTVPAPETLVQAMELVRNQTGAVAALLFYGDEGGFAGCGVGDDPDRYPGPALTYLQQRLVQLRVPLAFDLVDEEVSFITRAATKQRRDYIAWIVPTTGSWTELLVLRGSWPASAITPLLEFVDSAMPALTIMLGRFVGVGSKERLEQQLTAITASVETLGRSAEIIGSVAAVYPTTQGLPEDQVTMLKTLAESAAATLNEVKANRDLMQSHLRLQEYTSRLERAVEVEREHATTDVLTGLINHRGALQALETATESAKAEGSSLSLLMGDIDGFKLFNDTYGHVMGDEVLRLTADVCRKAVEPNGTVCRYGGDEFLIILPAHNKRAAKKLARQITERLGKAEFQTESKTIVPIRMSLGVATFPQDTSSPSELVAIADAAMYETKRRPQDAKGSVVSTRADTTFGEWLRDRKNRRLIPHRLEAVDYVPVRNESAKDGLWKLGGKRQVVYARRDLSIRDRFASAQNLVSGQCSQ